MFLARLFSLLASWLSEWLSSLNKEQRDEYKKRKLRNRRHQGHLASSLLLELLIFALLGGHLSHNHFLHLQRR